MTEHGETIIKEFRCSYNPTRILHEQLQIEVVDVFTYRLNSYELFCLTSLYRCVKISYCSSYRQDARYNLYHFKNIFTGEMIHPSGGSMPPNLLCRRPFPIEYCSETASFAESEFIPKEVLKRVPCF